MDRVIVALHGKAGSGKDTTAIYLRKKYGFSVHAHAASLKAAAKAIFGFTDSQVHDQTHKAEVDPYWGVTPGHVLQQVGTDLFRNHFGEDVWVKSLWRSILSDVDDRIVISDTRFVNEAVAARAHGAFLVKIVRSEPLRNLRGRDPKHVSETALDNWSDWDFVVDNNGSFEDLYASVDCFLKGVGLA